MNTQSIERLRKQLKKKQYEESRNRLHYEKTYSRGEAPVKRQYYTELDLDGKTDPNNKSAYWKVTVTIRCVSTVITKEFVTGREPLLEEIEDWVKFIVACLEFRRI